MQLWVRLSVLWSEAWQRRPAVQCQGLCLFPALGFLPLRVLCWEVLTGSWGGWGRAAHPLQHTWGAGGKGRGRGERLISPKAHCQQEQSDSTALICPKWCYYLHCRLGLKKIHRTAVGLWKLFSSFWLLRMNLHQSFHGSLPPTPSPLVSAVISEGWSRVGPGNIPILFSFWKCQMLSWGGWGDSCAQALTDCRLSFLVGRHNWFGPFQFPLCREASREFVEDLLTLKVRRGGGRWCCIHLPCQQGDLNNAQRTLSGLLLRRCFLGSILMCELCCVTLLPLQHPGAVQCLSKGGLELFHSSYLSFIFNSIFFFVPLTQWEQSSSPRLLLKLAVCACVFTCVLHINNPSLERFCWLQAKPCFCSWHYWNSSPVDCNS